MPHSTTSAPSPASRRGRHRTRVLAVAGVLTTALAAVGGAASATADTSTTQGAKPANAAAVPKAAVTASTSYEVASLSGQAHDVLTWGTSPWRGQYDWQTGAATGTSPSIATVPGGYEVAVHVNYQDDLWTLGAAGNKDWHVTMAPGTSPAIAALTGGGYEVAYQTSGGALAVVGTRGTKTYPLGMMPGTSPSIVGLPQGGTEIAFQSNAGTLWTVGDAGGRNWGFGMCRPSSPSITTQGRASYQVAVDITYTNCKQPASGSQPSNSVWTVSPAGVKDWKVGIYEGTSPSITRLEGGGVELALATNTVFSPPNADLWTIGAAGYKDWNIGLGKSSPAITAQPGGGFAVAIYPGYTNAVWVLNQQGLVATYPIIGPATPTTSSPAITH
ncbi:hypothetical protein [Lapillicoccus jejuensis]|uniref:Uncharacterized protein n=1 Tax=Lapillicoccus jejuensis TaxID=402171 RepID=A0A542E1R8_9MICO|nr:hypothetical protein [Lapillicoccus jejuensis]TQJ09280.1 hypothetical protein FB458_2390 [Lapillicoccus jejuensis]